MRAIATFVLLALTIPTIAQDLPKPTEAGKKALDELIRRCTAAGGLQARREQTGSGPVRLTIADAAKLKAAVRADQTAQIPALRDALVARWAEVPPEQEPVIVALLRALGDAADDGLALAFADFFEAKHEEARVLGSSIRLYGEAARRFEAAAERAWQATCYHNVAGVHDRRGEYAKALEGYRKALDIRLAVYGEQHSDVATGYNNIAAVHYRQSEYAQALEGYQKALEIERTLPGERHPAIATCYNNIAAVNDDRGDLARALEGYQKALEILREAYGERHPAVATSYNNIAGISYRQGEYARALEGYRKALDIDRSVLGEGHPAIAGIYNNIAAVYFIQGEYAQALDSFRKALDILQARYGERHPDVARSYNGIALVYHYQGEFARALEVNRKALDIRRAIYGERHPDVATSYNSIAGVYHGLGDHARALGVYQQALDIRRAIFGERHPDVARTLNNIATVYLDQGEYSRALEGSQEALDILRVHFGERHPDVARCYNIIAGADRGQGEYARALEVYGKALDIWRAVHGERHPDVATCYSNIAAVRHDQGEYARALEGHRKALDIRRAIHGDLYPDVAESYNNIAGIYLDQGEYAQALDGFRKALDIKRGVYDAPHPSLATAYNNLAFVYQDQGEYALALEGFRKALDIRRSVYGERHPDVAAIYNNIASIHHSRGEDAEALEVMRKALDIKRAVYGERHPDVALGHNNIAFVYASQGEVTKALDAFDRAVVALSIPADSTAGTVAARAGVAFWPLPITVNVLQRRARVREQSLGPDPVAGLHDCLRGYQAASDVLDQVRQRVLVSDPSRLQLGEESSELFPRTIDVAARLAEAERMPAARLAALAAAERGSARVFLEGLGRSRAVVVGRVDPGLQDEEAKDLACIREIDDQTDRALSQTFDRRDSAAIRRLFDERRQADERLHALIARMERDYPQYAALKYPQACTIAEARACLASDEVALLYVLGSEASYLILLTRDGLPETGGITIHKLAPAGEIVELVIALARPVTLEDSNSVRELGCRAFQVLLAPVAEAIRGKALVIVPGGVLGLLPFELLVEPAEGAKDAAAGDGRFLVEGHRIRYAPSITALHLVRQWDGTRKRPERLLWAVGDPVYQASDPRLTSPTPLSQETRYAEDKYSGGVRVETFRRLPATGAEVDQLRQFLGAEPDEVLVGREATEAAVKADSESGKLATYRYIHFATHGILGLADATPPSLVLSLAGDQHGEDGFLTLGEVTGLRLNADLVVLSACQTGQGRLYKAEGVNGLARAFLSAGSRGVLCSLWRVDDEATAGLMADVYAGLKAGRSAPEALRAAQLKRIAADEPPLHWAPFILIGE
jgi:tetratricopeptide (TPR) repeat protein/CHAT domain-containing protein